MFLTVTISGISATDVARVNDTTLTFKLPSGLDPGNHPVTVTTPAGSVTSSQVVTVVDRAAGNDFVLLIGQSLATGYNYQHPYTTDPDILALLPPIGDDLARSWIFNGASGAWDKLSVHTNQAVNGAALDPAIGYARVWEDQNPTGNLYIVKDTWPGEPIENWAKGGKGNYESALSKSLAARALLAAANTVIRDETVLVVHGEANPYTPAPQYTDALNVLMTSLRADGALTANTQEIISLVVEDGNIHDQQTAYVAAHPDRAKAQSKSGYTRAEDNVHITHRMYEIMGVDVYNVRYNTSLPRPFPIVPVVVTLPVVTLPVVTLPVVTLPVVTLPVVTLPVVTPPVVTPPVVTPPVVTPPVVTPPVTAVYNAPTSGFGAPFIPDQEQAWTRTGAWEPYGSGADFFLYSYTQGSTLSSPTCAAKTARVRVTRFNGGGPALYEWVRTSDGAVMDALAIDLNQDTAGAYEFDLSAPVVGVYFLRVTDTGAAVVNSYGLMLSN
jgi:hypothetical protein